MFYDHKNDSGVMHEIKFASLKGFYRPTKSIRTKLSIAIAETIVLSGCVRAD